MVQAAGAHAVLDVSGHALRVGCAAGSFLVKPNAAEAGRLTGVRIASLTEAHEASARIHALGVRHIVISLVTLGRSTRMGGCLARRTARD